MLTKNLISKLTLIAGLLLAIVSITALTLELSGLVTRSLLADIESTSFIMMSLLQLMAGLFMTYASWMKVKGHDIADKLYPSCIATQILLLLMWQYSGQ